MPRARRRLRGIPRALRFRLQPRRPAAAGRAARRHGGGRSRRSSKPRAICCRCCWSGRRCATARGSTIARWPSIAAAFSAWSRRSTCPITANSTSIGTSPRVPSARTSRSPSGASRRRSVRICCSPPRMCRASWSMRKSARTFGCRCRRAGWRRWRAPPCWPTFRPATSRSARPTRGACSANRSRAAVSRPIFMRRRARANPPPTSPGTGRPRSSRTAPS